MVMVRRCRRAGGGASAAAAAGCLPAASLHGIAGERRTSAENLYRLVIVHPSNDEDNCISSAGRKQRGSFNSLLLLEAHDLSMASSPNLNIMQPEVGPGRYVSPRHRHPF